LSSHPRPKKSWLSLKGFFDAMAKGHIIELSDVGYTIIPTPAVDEAEDTVSLSKDVTGVSNTIFVSTKGYARHAARIKPEPTCKGMTITPEWELKEVGGVEELLKDE
jgi:hypothetical protein